MQRMIFGNAKVFDGINFVDEADVVIEEERISAVVTRPNTVAVNPYDIVYDVTGMTLMPGVVASHGHFSLQNIDLRIPVGPDLNHSSTYKGIIDHGDHFDEELADLAVATNTYVLPSLYIAKAAIGVYHGPDDVERSFDLARDSIAVRIEKGVKYVTGDDFGLAELPHGENAKELELYVNELGVPAAEVLKWATANGAQMSGIPDIGRIEAGKLADLVVVGGDPIEDISVLIDPNKISLVMKGGAIANSSLAS